jgi:hypothetical protein
MYTQKELNVLQSALRSWAGPYGDDHGQLIDEEIERKNQSLFVASALAERIEALLMERYVLDQEVRFLREMLTKGR